MKPVYFLGIDGGQTSTISALCDADGRLLGVGHAGPSNHIHEPGGVDRLRSALRMSIGSAWTAAGLGDPQAGLPSFQVVCCGMTGGSKLVAELIQDFARIEQLLAYRDHVTAHAGALAGQPGVVVIAGTGSVAYGVNVSGQTARAGGWAYLMGDEGSGYDIGRQALVAAARAADGRDAKTLLYERVLAYFQASDIMDVRRRVYSRQFERAHVAKLATLVGETAKDGDPAALAILEQAGASLAEIALAVMKNLEMDTGNVDVSYVGGVFRAGDLIIKPFYTCLQRVNPDTQVQPPVFSPVIGALLMGLRAGGITIDAEVQGRLHQADKLVEKG